MEMYSIRERFYSNKFFHKIIISILIVFFSLFAAVGCSDNPEENAVFLNEKANLHSEYYVTVNSVTTLDQISVLANEQDEVKTVLYGTDRHYIAVNVTIEHINVAIPKEDVMLESVMFKLKDHTGIKAGVLISFVENGTAISEADFSTLESVVDYSWIGSSINASESKTMTIHFEVDKSIDPNVLITVLEIDFFFGGVLNKSDLGTDIVLLSRQS